MFNKSIIIKKKAIKVNKPLAIAGFPGVGNVGNLTSTHLVKELKAIKIATLYSPHFPHHVTMLKTGGIRIPSNKFYLVKGKKKQRDLIIVTGDVQAISPEGQYEVNSLIVDFLVDALKCTTIYTIGGYNREGMVTDQPRVFGNVNKKHMIDLFKSYGVVFGETQGTILGSAGLIIALAKMKGVEGICLLGESNFLDLDAAAAKAVINVLNNNLKFNVSTTDFDALISKAAAVIGSPGGQPQIGIPISGQGFGGDESKPSYIR